MSRTVLRTMAWLVALGVVPMGAHAQMTATGRITGQVVDERTGRPIGEVEVRLVATNVTVQTDLDGRFVLSDVPVGPVVIEVRRIGYSFKTVTQVGIAPGETTVLDVALVPATFNVEAIIVTATVERGTVSRALDEQRNASGIVNALSAEQIERSPDSDAGQAMQRVSGVTVEGGKYVLIRGLGERYSTTALNGSRIPSADPDRRVVSLDLIPAGLLEAVTTSKTFSADQAGDFAGAQVNLRTREFPSHHVFRFSLSTGFNDAVTGRHLATAPAAANDWLAFGAAERALPGNIREAGNLQGVPRQDVGQLIGSFRNVWSAEIGTGALPASFSLSFGGQDPVVGQPIGYIGSLTYSYSQGVRENERKATAVTSGDEPLNEYFGSTGTTEVLWGGLLNLSTRLGPATKISLYNTYNRRADNEATRLGGTNEEFGTEFDITRLTYVERSVRSHQLRGEHLLASRHRWEWSGSVSRVARDEPDRSDLVYEAERMENGDSLVGVRWWGGPRSATRTFSNLAETSHETGTSIRFALGDAGGDFALKVGGAYRAVSRDADSRAYDIVNLGLDREQRGLAPEGIFDGPFASGGQLLLQPNVLGGQYDATDRNLAGFVQLELPLVARLRVIAGVRVEQADMLVNSLTPQGTPDTARLDNTDILPSLGVTLALSSRSNLRLSATQTVARPEYRELANTSSFDVLGGLFVFGNPSLRRSLIQNADLRWEFFPTPGEVLSVSLFAKHFDDPIERVLLALTGKEGLTYINAKSARNYGVEFEVRRSLGMLATSLTPFTTFGNVMVMQSDIEPGEGTALTNANRPMVGQSEYVINAGLEYASWGGSLTSTLLYNVVGPRITEAGVEPRPDAIERERHLIDYSLRWQATQPVGFKLDAKNLLNAPHEIMQGSVIRHRYTTGRVFSAGITWSL
ncbi:MAG TPA: TonB-dependent receptor [Gemmatimonadales bacterium]